MKISKTTLAALIYAFTTPLMIWAGIVLSQGDYPLGVFLVAVVTTIDFFGSKIWLNAQAEMINE